MAERHRAQVCIGDEMGQDDHQKLERLQVPEIGELIDGRYRVQGVLATGGMGVILRAEQLPMGRPVAIKLLHPHIAAANPDIVERFEREVRLAKHLNHPNTIRLYDFGESERGLVYVAMELLEGMDLKRLIACEGGLQAGRALEICRQMLDGLAEAHAHDFIHRDLKPSNVFIVKNRRGGDSVKLLDFGIAKSLGDGGDLTGSGSICGTPAYVAPEYLMLERAAKSSDIYAVGLILLEMLTGRQVFKGEAPVQTMMMHLKIDPTIPEELEGTALEALIRKATAKDPKRRFADAEQMYEAVCEVMTKVADDLVVRRPAHDVPPRVSEELAVETTPEGRRRAHSDTIVPEVHGAARAVSQASGSWSWGTRQTLAWVGVAVMVAGAGLSWLVDPGRAPELAAPSTSGGFSSGATASADASGAASSASREVSEPAETKRSETKRKAQQARWGFEFDTDPSGASVEVGGRKLGRTPLSHGFLPAELPQTVRFELDGYEPREVELTQTSSPFVIEALEELPAKKARRASQRRAAKRRKDAGDRPAARRRGGEETAPQSKSEASNELSDKRIEEVMERYLVE